MATPPARKKSSRNKDDDGVYNIEGGEKVLAAGSLGTIIDYLLEKGDINLYRTFIAAFPNATKATLVWKTLMSRYKKDSLRLRNRVLDFVTMWTDLCFARDFVVSTKEHEDESITMTKLYDFVQTASSSGYSEKANRIKLLMWSRKPAFLTEQLSGEKATPIKRFLKDDPRKRSSSKLHEGQFDFKDLDPSAVADQLTVMEWSLFNRMEDSELFHLNWKKENGKQIAPNVFALTERANTVSFWVATEIVMSGELRERTAVLKKFINVADRCFKIGNFNTLWEILAGLSMSSVRRLKNTWANVPKEDVRMLTVLEACMDSQFNFKNYREEISRRETEGQRTLPYLGIYLRDLVFTDEGNKDFVDGLINFDKLNMLGKIFLELHRFQEKEYDFELDGAQSRFLQKLLVLPEEVLYKHSLMCEAADSDIP